MLLNLPAFRRWHRRTRYLRDAATFQSAPLLQRREAAPLVALTHWTAAFNATISLATSELAPAALCERAYELRRSLINTGGQTLARCPWLHFKTTGFKNDSRDANQNIGPTSFQGYQIKCFRGSCSWCWRCVTDRVAEVHCGPCSHVLYAANPDARFFPPSTPLKVTFPAGKCPTLFLGWCLAIISIPKGVVSNCHS